MAIEIEKTNLLLVEGREDGFFFEAFIKHAGLQNIQIMDYGGKNNLRPYLKALINTSGFADVISLGVVRDANENPLGAFQSVRDALQAVNLSAPERPLMPVGSNPTITVLIIPEENTPGALEVLCLRAVEQDPAIPCLKQYFDCLKKKSLSLPGNRPKAEVQAFLASRPEAGKRLGEAAQAGYWPFDNKAFQQAKNFLEQVASERSG